MEGPWRMMVGAGLLLCFVQTGLAMRCSREDFFGQTKHFYCPDDGNEENRFCCGYGDNKYCCSIPFDDEALEDIIEKLPTILGVVAAILVGIIVLCVVCCCCCPFCLCYKRSSRGTIHNPNRDVSAMQPLQNQPQNYAPQPQAAPYPAQPAYAPQPAPYPTQPGYPPQPYPPQGYPAEQPPMYTEKPPPPYNPTY